MFIIMYLYFIFYSSLADKISAKAYENSNVPSVIFFTLSITMATKLETSKLAAFADEHSIFKQAYKQLNRINLKAGRLMQFDNGGVEYAMSSVRGHYVELRVTGEITHRHVQELFTASTARFPNTFSNHFRTITCLKTKSKMEVCPELFLSQSSEKGGSGWRIDRSCCHLPKYSSDQTSSTPLGGCGCMKVIVSSRKITVYGDYTGGTKLLTELIDRLLHEEMHDITRVCIHKSVSPPLSPSTCCLSPMDAKELNDILIGSDSDSGNEGCYIDDDCSSAGEQHLVVDSFDDIAALVAHRHSSWNTGSVSSGQVSSTTVIGNDFDSQVSLSAVISTVLKQAPVLSTRVAHTIALRLNREARHTVIEMYNDTLREKAITRAGKNNFDILLLKYLPLFVLISLVSQDLGVPSGLFYEKRLFVNADPASLRLRQKPLDKRVTICRLKTFRAANCGLNPVSESMMHKTIDYVYAHLEGRFRIMSVNWAVDGVAEAMATYVSDPVALKKQICLVARQLVCNGVKYELAASLTVVSFLCTIGHPFVATLYNQPSAGSRRDRNPVFDLCYEVALVFYMTEKSLSKEYIRLKQTDNRCSKLLFTSDNNLRPMVVRDCIVPTEKMPIEKVRTKNRKRDRDTLARRAIFSPRCQPRTTASGAKKRRRCHQQQPQQQQQQQGLTVSACSEELAQPQDSKDWLDMMPDVSDVDEIIQGVDTVLEPLFHPFVWPDCIRQLSMSPVKCDDAEPYDDVLGKMLLLDLSV